MANIIKVARLFPNILYLHGDRNNGVTLTKIAEKMGLTIDIEDINYKTENFNPNNYDIILCSAGEISSFETILNWLHPYKKAFDEYIENGKVLLVTGTSVGMFGKTVVRRNGSVIDGLALADFECVERKSAYGDDILFTCNYGGKEMECVGIQIQMLDVISETCAFGQLKYGYGNTSKNKDEGIIRKNSIFTNSLGPLLTLNPWLAKEILVVAANNIGYNIINDSMMFEMELKSLNAKKNYIATKVTKLTNCL